ncbi:putative mitochondrial carrier [Colletotrichum gloeosporioides]|uniref:Putative mitochondrial carrier n=1 Tax=Colletotrichum gloeosporioides TaxID=474922 RepID=A0A8H4FUF9_COLGL|nr:putative mitochondrial carrier [Colletotrichum gloeosporioides]KAF3811864.1 putative mitochondrial carrier [Colletotrichum gloeosporioides]
MQSPVYKTQYKTVNGSFNRTFFRGLYQGFGPTIITGIPSSAAFFTIYERLKTVTQDAKSAGSAVADLVSCAIINPAEVLKQNAQMHGGDALKPVNSRQSPTLLAVKHFARNPGRLWAGYTALAASHLPATSLSFCLYELLRERFLGEVPRQRLEASASRQVAVSTFSGALAGGFACTLFVPVDVVKTRMRLAAGNTPRLGPLDVANGIFRKEGIHGLFRGGTLSFLASALGCGLYLGSYEACILFL